jgi:uncharacterized protein YdaU (DUF1376 family)
MSGNSFPWMPWFHRDFIAATQGWTLLERAAYFMLLGAQWEMGPLPNDRRRLACIIGAQLEELQSVWPVVGTKFRVSPGGLLNHRLEEHRMAQIERSDKARTSALIRWGKRNPDANASADAHANADADGNARTMLPDPDPDPDPKPEPTTGDIRRQKPTRAYMRRAFHEEVIAAYHELLPELPSVKDWSERRSRKLNARVRERLASGKPADTIEYWRGLFGKAAASDFLCGRKGDWRCPGIEWLLEPRNFTKLIEGAYDQQLARGTIRAA